MGVAGVIFEPRPPNFVLSILEPSLVVTKGKQRIADLKNSNTDIFLV